MLDRFLSQDDSRETRKPKFGPLKIRQLTTNYLVFQAFSDLAIQSIRYDPRVAIFTVR